MVDDHGPDRVKGAGRPKRSSNWQHREDRILELMVESVNAALESVIEVISESARRRFRQLLWEERISLQNFNSNIGRSHDEEDDE
jgi:hypothetical protein